MLWIDPAMQESGAMARSAAALGLRGEVREIERGALRRAQGHSVEGASPAVRRAMRQDLERAGGSGEAPSGSAATPEEALAAGVFDVPALVHEGRVHRDLRLRSLRPAPSQSADATLPAELYLDLADPASFVAATRAERILGRGVRWHLVQGASLRAGHGLADPIREGTELERAWWRRRLDEDSPAPIAWSALSVRPLIAARALHVLGVDRLPLLHLFHALWTQGRDLSDRAVLDATLTELNLDPTAILADADPTRLHAATAAAESAGVFTTPTVVVNRSLFVGLDALPDAGAAARISTNLVSIGR